MKYIARVPNVNVESEQSEDSPGRKDGDPDLKHLTKLEMSSPDLSEVRVQHLTKLEMSSPDLSEVRVQH